MGALVKEKDLHIYTVLADLHKFATGEVLFADAGSIIRQIYFARDKIYIVTDTALWRYDSQNETLEILDSFSKEQLFWLTK